MTLIVAVHASVQWKLLQGPEDARRGPVVLERTSAVDSTQTPVGLE